MEKNTAIWSGLAIVGLAYYWNYRTNKRINQVGKASLYLARAMDTLVQAEIDREFDQIINNYEE